MEVHAKMIEQTVVNIREEGLKLTISEIAKFAQSLEKADQIDRKMQIA